ncbi:hypothetical protein WN943_020464 [Citrus x changshan-huyou]
MSNYLLFILLLSVSLFAKPLLCDPRATRAALICTNRTASSSLRRTFITNFLAAMDIVTPLIARQRYAAVVNGTGTASVYAFGECMKDLSPNDCNLCFAQCKTQVLKCLPFQLATRGGRVFYDGCYLRYDDYDFFNESLSSQDRTVCGSQDFGGNNTVFGANAIELVRNLSVQAVKNDGFFVGSVTFSKGNVSVHGLAQCWEFVNGSACENCLENAVSRIASCTQKEEGRVLNAGCYLRSFSSIVDTVIYRTSIKERKQLGALQVAVNKSKLNFSYETLEKATNYFHESNKLGQGGSGSVYKGTLPGGEAVAVKRLFYNTTQWVDHFFNEVNLISGINHKNLVKLLGCSITGPESLLVYEFVPNQSLLDNLFVRQDVEPLSWEVRYKIILSAAEGLTYLHEESKLRIIHRDIKLSNILLDEDFTAKIADFGLVRLFPEDITHISATLAGTLGYMAPEYVVRGKLTEKADVYSFGVVIIEVVCRKRINLFTQNSFSILQTVWDLYVKGRLHEAVDPALAGNFQEGEPSRLLQIGLLCVQASAELRPSMSIVVKMLTGNHEILQPTQPPFLNPNGSEISSVGTPSTSNSK